jgi:hypothetical protein
MDPDRDALRKKCEEILKEAEWVFPKYSNSGSGCTLSDQERIGHVQVGVPVYLLMELRRDLARLEWESMGTDRHGLADDKLGRAVSKLTSHIISELQHHGSVNYTYPEFQEALKAVRDAARDETTTKEAEKPKRASLVELVEACEAVSKHRNAYCDQWERPMKEVAAVLRAVGEFREDKISVSELIRSLP